MFYLYAPATRVVACLCLDDVEEAAVVALVSFGGVVVRVQDQPAPSHGNCGSVYLINLGMYVFMVLVHRRKPMYSSALLALPGSFALGTAWLGPR